MKRTLDDCGPSFATELNQEEGLAGLRGEGGTVVDCYFCVLQSHNTIFHAVLNRLIVAVIGYRVTFKPCACVTVQYIYLVLDI